MAHVERKTSPCTFHVTTRSGAEIAIRVDEIIERKNELGPVRFKLDGEVAGVVPTNQIAAWRTSVPRTELAAASSRGGG